MPTEADLLQAIAREPGDALAWIALADCLEENGEADRAELVRLREWLRFADRKDRQRPQKEKRLQALLAAGVRPAVPRSSFALADGVSLELALVPPGSFWMGTSGEEGGEGLNERPRHRVTLTRGFWLGTCPLTQRQWEAFMPDNPSYYRGDDRPVENVSWSRARLACRRLGKRLGGVFRLPTEAEWEYACRAGTYSRYHSGKDEAALRRAGWFRRSHDEGTAPVGRLVPNAWGLHDMHGNVYEWCADRFRTFGHEDVVDPVGAEGTSHCIRGGYWGRPMLSCRSAFRDSYSRGVYSSIAGFRVARELGGAAPARRRGGGRA